MRKGFTGLAATAVAAFAGAVAEAGPAEAGDAAAGEAVFKQCQTCHVVQAADGTFIAGKAGKTGPNLFGVVGRTAGTYPDFKFGDDLIAAGAKGLVWDEAQIAAYIQDPAGFLKTYLADDAAKAKMTFKLKKPDDAANVAAFLAQYPAP